MDPRDKLYEDMYKCHGCAQVTVSERGSRSSIYLGSEGGTPRLRLLATDDNGVLSCAYIQCCISVWGGPGLAHNIYGLYDADKGAMKAEG